VQGLQDVIAWGPGHDAHRQLFGHPTGFAMGMALDTGLRGRAVEQQGKDLLFLDLAALEAAIAVVVAIVARRRASGGIGPHDRRPAGAEAPVTPARPLARQGLAIARLQARHHGELAARARRHIAQEVEHPGAVVHPAARAAPIALALAAHGVGRRQTRVAQGHHRTRERDACLAHPRHLALRRLRLHRDGVGRRGQRHGGGEHGHGGKGRHKEATHPCTPMLHPGFAAARPCPRSRHVASRWMPSAAIEHGRV
jgi:hypothetical protein